MVTASPTSYMLSHPYHYMYCSRCCTLINTALCPHVVAAHVPVVVAVCMIPCMDDTVYALYGDYLPYELLVMIYYMLP